jgi:hypothetical protein
MTLQQRYSDLVRVLRDSVLGAAGDTDAAVRRSVAAYAATHGAAGGSGAEAVPDALRTYVDKVGRFAYRVTNEDVEALKHAGYSEDAIFEVTVSAAVGAGLHRLERGLTALRGER